MGKRLLPQPKSHDHQPPGDGRRGLWATVPPSVLVLTGIFSVQLGAGLAAKLFSQVPPAAVTGLRLWSSGLVMVLAGRRPLWQAVTGLVRRREPAGTAPGTAPDAQSSSQIYTSPARQGAPGAGARPASPAGPQVRTGRWAWRDMAVVVGFGLTLAVMNYAIYQSFARIPLGISVTVEFLGPLGVAVVSSRRALDVLWVLLAGSGVALLARGGTALPGHGGPGHGGSGHGALLAGLAFALLAGLAWAAYIMLSRATGRLFPGSTGLAIAMVVAAIAITPVGVAAGHGALLRPSVLITGLAIGLLSSIVPYSLELEALRRIPARVFGIWMSLEPAVAAVVGLVILGQSLAVRDWLAIGCVMIACAGAARGARQPQA